MHPHRQIHPIHRRTIGLANYAVPARQSTHPSSSVVPDVAEDFIEEVQANESSTSEDEVADIPHWDELDLATIYDALNPFNRKGQKEQRAWKPNAVDKDGRSLKRFGYITSKLLKQTQYRRSYLIFRSKMD